MDSWIARLLISSIFLVTYGNNAVVDFARPQTANNYDAAKEFCRNRNLFLPSYKINDDANWVGLEEASENLYTQNDGTYNHYLTKT